VTSAVLLVVMALLDLQTGAPTAASTGRVTVTLKGFQEARGSARVSVTDAKGFLGRGRPTRAQAVVIRDGLATVTFVDVPYGRYAVQAYHDENDNRRLDRNFFGMPSEPYGFSNNVRSATRAPTFDEAAFVLDRATMTLDIQVR
jgi:uncharacterized protein (DUF2141 family)